MIRTFKARAYTNFANVETHSLPENIYIFSSRLSADALLRDSIKNE